MAIVPYLAMTKAEIRANPAISHPIAWMACHFSPYSTGVSNLPRQLPQGSLLILNDRTSWWCHDSRLIAGQLAQCLEQFHCRGLLLDFQRPGVPEEQELAALLARELKCPVCVSEAYAKELSCPVFLSPAPLTQRLCDYLKLWEGREIWLEAALGCEEILLTEEGCTAASLPRFQETGSFLPEGNLHCHYRVSIEESGARFTLTRTRDDLDALLAEAEGLGVTTAVGLWQELHNE